MTESRTISAAHSDTDNSHLSAVVDSYGHHRHEYTNEWDLPIGRSEMAVSDDWKLDDDSDQHPNRSPRSD